MKGEKHVKIHENDAIHDSIFHNAIPFLPNPPDG